MKDDVKKVVEKVLDDNYYCKKDGFIFEYDIYADYRDEMSDKDVEEILSSNDPMFKFSDVLYEGYQYYIWELKTELIKKIREECEEELVDDFEVEDYEEIEEFVDCNVLYILPESHYLDQTFEVNIMVDTGDGNYDYVLNSVYPAYCGRYKETIDDKASIVWLANTQGYKKSELSKALNDGDIENPNGFLQSMRQEVVNIASHMSVLTFLVKMTLRELIELNELIKLQDRHGKFYDARKRPYCGYIVIDKSAETGLYDPWNGGGSVFEIELEKDVKLPIKYIRSANIDGADGYSIESVYGMCRSVWRDEALKEIHAPRKVS